MGKTRRAFLAGLVSLALATPAAAQDAATQSVIRQLEAQGFSVTDVGRTLLGRVRVVAVRGDLTREVVFDPRNGQILRDYTRGAAGPFISDDDRDDADRGSDDGGDTDGASGDEEDDDDDGDDDGDDGGGGGGGDDDDDDD